MDQCVAKLLVRVCALLVGKGCTLSEGRGGGDRKHEYRIGAHFLLREWQWTNASCAIHPHGGVSPVAFGSSTAEAAREGCRADGGGSSCAHG